MPIGVNHIIDRLIGTASQDLLGDLMNTSFFIFPEERVREIGGGGVGEPENGN